MSQTRFDIQRAAVIGAGTMGRGIVMSLANAGVQVLWLDNNPEMLEQALGVVADTYAHNVRQGRIDETQAAARRACISKAADYQALAEVDLVIEAVYENLELKQNIFRELDVIVKPSGILASNTSALDIDAIAAVTQRPEQVVGLHFFSPAHIMKLLEIVRGAKTSKAVLQASTELGKRMGKISVIAGNCPGFIGNRMLKTYVREARAMLLEGAYPHQVDAALQAFGFAMGAKILEEGMAESSTDIDTVYLNGYGFPADVGGPMTWADRQGLPAIRDRLNALAERHGEHWKPAELIDSLATLGGRFVDYKKEA